MTVALGHYDEDDPRDLLSDLFKRSEAYSRTEAYLETIKFVTRFKSQGPYNAYLLARQNPRVSFATSAREWERDYGARLKLDARPLIILVPFGPVAFVYDIEDVVGSKLPKGVLNPFPASGIVAPETWENIVRNAEAFNIAITLVPGSGQAAGKAIRLPQPVVLKSALDTETQQNLFGSSHLPVGPSSVTARYIVELNDRHKREQSYITLLHELAHITCGHLGRTFRPDGRPHPWRDRQNLPHEVVELEAESVAYIVGRRTGVESRPEIYLAPYMEAVQSGPHLDRFSFNAVLSAATRLETWGRKPPRKQDAKQQRQGPDNAT